MRGRWCARRRRGEHGRGRVCGQRTGKLNGGGLSGVWVCGCVGVRVCGCVGKCGTGVVLGERNGRGIWVWIRVCNQIRKYVCVCGYVDNVTGRSG